MRVPCFLNNPDIVVKDERILELDTIVNEVKESEEWEAVRMNILETGIAHGKEQGLAQGIEQGKKEGLEQGRQEGLVQGLFLLVKKNRLTIEEAAEEAKRSVEEFKRLLEREDML